MKVIDLDAKLADGQARMNAEMNFSAALARLQVGVTVNDVNVQQLPRSWGIPAEVGGKLSGHAELTMQQKDTGVQTDGKGEGTIKDATRGGDPVAPIRISLEAAGGGYRFKLD